MKPETSIFDPDPDADAEAIRQARDDIAAGRFVPHEEVAKWLRTWGTPQSGPPPEEWFK